jgi:hypothetical protein
MKSQRGGILFCKAAKDKIIIAGHAVLYSKAVIYIK